MTTSATEEQHEGQLGTMEECLEEVGTELDAKGQQVRRGDEVGSSFHTLPRSLNSAKGCNKEVGSCFSLNL